MEDHTRENPGNPADNLSSPRHVVMLLQITQPPGCLPVVPQEKESGGLMRLHVKVSHYSRNRNLSKAK